MRYLVGESISRYHVRRPTGRPPGDEVCAISQRKHGRQSPWQQIPRRLTAASAAEAEASSNRRAGRNELPDNILDRFIQLT